MVLQQFCKQCWAADMSRHPLIYQENFVTIELCSIENS